MYHSTARSPCRGQRRVSDREGPLDGCGNAGERGWDSAAWEGRTRLAVLAVNVLPEMVRPVAWPNPIAPPTYRRPQPTVRVRARPSSALHAAHRRALCSGGGGRGGGQARGWRQAGGARTPRAVFASNVLPVTVNAVLEP